MCNHLLLWLESLKYKLKINTKKNLWKDEDEEEQEDDWNKSNNFMVCSCVLMYLLGTQVGDWLKHELIHVLEWNIFR